MSNVEYSSMPVCPIAFPEERRTSRLQEKEFTDCLRIVHGQFADTTCTQHQHIQCHTSGTVFCAHSGMPLNWWHTEVCIVRWQILCLSRQSIRSRSAPCKTRSASTCNWSSKACVPSLHLHISRRQTVGSRGDIYCGKKGPGNALNDKHKRWAWALNSTFPRLIWPGPCCDLYLNLIWSVRMVSAVLPSSTQTVCGLIFQQIRCSDRNSGFHCTRFQ